MTFCVIYEVCGWGLPNTGPSLAQKWFVIWSFTHSGIIICYSERSPHVSKKIWKCFSGQLTFFITYGLIRIQNLIKLLLELITILLCPVMEGCLDYSPEREENIIILLQKCHSFLPNPKYDLVLMSYEYVQILLRNNVTCYNVTTSDLNTMFIRRKRIRV